MRLSLFRLRRDEKQASLLRNMARYLRKHPEFEISETLYDDPKLSQPLRFAAPMQLKSYIDTKNTAIEVPLTELVQALRKPVNQTVTTFRETSLVEISSVENIIAEHDYFEEQAELLFEKAIISGQAISAIDFWKASVCHWSEAGYDIDPKPWIELVFSCYCKLTNEQQSALDIKMKGIKVEGTSDNYSYSDVQISMKKTA